MAFTAKRAEVVRFYSEIARAMPKLASVAPRASTRSWSCTIPTTGRLARAGGQLRGLVRHRGRRDRIRAREGRGFRQWESSTASCSSARDPDSRLRGLPWQRAEHGAWAPGTTTEIATGFDLSLTEDGARAAHGSRLRAREEVLPLAREIDEKGKIPPALIKEMASLGLLGIAFRRSTAAPASTRRLRAGLRRDQPRLRLGRRDHERRTTRSRATRCSSSAARRRRSEFLRPLARRAARLLRADRAGAGSDAGDDADAPRGATATTGSSTARRTSSPTARSADVHRRVRA